MQDGERNVVHFEFPKGRRGIGIAAIALGIIGLTFLVARTNVHQFTPGKQCVDLAGNTRETADFGLRPRPADSGHDPVDALALNERHSSSFAPSPALTLTSPFCRIDPGVALRFYRDSSRRLTLPQVRAIPPGEWFAFKGEPTSFGFTSDIFWLRLPLKSALAESGEVVVELANSRMEKVDWFALRHGDVKEKEFNGNQRPSFGPLPRSREPNFRVKLAAGEEVEIIARVESRTSMFLPVLVHGNPETKANEAAKCDWLALAVTGYFGSVFCLSVVLGFILRSRLLQINAVIALLLCVYFLLVDGSWARLGLPFAAQLAMKPTMLLIAGMDFLVVLFMREFIPPPFENRIPGRMLGIMLMALAVEILLIPFLSYRNDFRLVALMAFIVMGTCTIVAWWLQRIQPGGGTRLLLAAWMTNLAVVVGVVLELIGVIPNWLPPSLAPAIYGVTISGMLLAASTQRAQEFMREQLHASQLERSLSEARLLALRYQVNPHFLFNSLYSAIALSQYEPARVTPFLYRLARFLRGTLRSERILTVPLAEEVEELSAYLDVEKVRFEEQLEVTLDFPAELGGWQVPDLILQPLVENAIKHGMTQAGTVHQIRIRAWCEGDQLQIEVANTGRLGAATALDQDNEGIGLSNLRERLRLLYQERATLSLTEASSWVIARLSLPVSEQPPGDFAASPQKNLGDTKPESPPQ